MEPSQVPKEPFYSVYVEPPKLELYDFNNDMNYLSRSHVIDAITFAIRHDNMEGLALKVKKLLDLGSLVNWTAKVNHNLIVCGLYATPLHIVSEYLQDKDLIKVLLSHGAVTHKIPSQKAQEKIDRAAQEILFDQFEQSKWAFHSMNVGPPFDVLPIELRKRIIELTVESCFVVKTLASIEISEKERKAECDEIVNSIKHQEASSYSNNFQVVSTSQK